MEDKGYKEVLHKTHEVATRSDAKMLVSQKRRNEMETQVCDCEQHEPLKVIVKPTINCNLGCVYCYEGKNTYRGQRMNYDTLRNTIVKFARYNGPQAETQFIWHGGEPLLMGLEFFTKIVEIQDELGPERTFSNGIQTNGTLITGEFCDLFEERDFGVGVSLDGPQWLHDLQRPYPNGRSSFDDVMAGIALIRGRQTSNNGHPVCDGVLAVLTRNTLANRDEFYEFFQSRKLNFKVNPIYYEGRGGDVREDLGIEPGEYGKAMMALFDHWFYRDGSFLTIDPLDEMLGNLITGRSRSCRFAESCYKKYLEVAPNGDVYPCAGRNLRIFCLGNINEKSLEEILASPVLERFKTERMQLPEHCASCNYFSICHGGCIRQAFMQQERLSDRDYYCPSYKVLYEHLRQVLLQELGTVPIAACEDINFAAIKNPALQRVVQSRLPSESQDPQLWMDKEWAQWRGKYSVWSGKWSGDWEQHIKMT